MNGLNAVGGAEIIRERIDNERPVLGICIGMQILFQEGSEHGENGNHAGVGVWEGEVSRLDAPILPHMGWNNVFQSGDHPLWQGIQQDSQFYFVHSYYADIENNPYVAAYCDYGVKFAAALSHNNLFAVQFHPEKSADNGLQLLRNFTQWVV